MKFYRPPRVFSKDSATNSYIYKELSIVVNICQISEYKSLRLEGYPGFWQIAMSDGMHFQLDDEGLEAMEKFMVKIGAVIGE